MYYFPEYVSKAEKTAKALKDIKRIAKTIKNVQPVEAFNGPIAKTFWGKSWCLNLEKYAYNYNRLERGRSYVRAGCVCHLDIQKGRILAKTSGAKLYTTIIDIAPLSENLWQALCDSCAGHTASVLELLQGKISDEIMQKMCHPTLGLFPTKKDIKFSCSCPDSAIMCKHVAAALYAVGRRLDNEPEMLFLLRNVNAEELVTQKLTFIPEDACSIDETLQNAELGDIFGIDIDFNAQVDELSSFAKKPEAVSSPKKKPLKAKAVKSTKGTKQSNKKINEKAQKTRKPITLCGKDIALFREKHSLPVSAFALLIGVTTNTIRRWEKNADLHLNTRSYAKLEELFYADH